MNTETLSPAEYFKQARSRFRKDDFSGAEMWCSRAMAAGLNDVDVYYLRGLSRHGAGYLSGAIEDYTLTIERYAYHALAYDKLAEARAATEDKGSAQQDALSAMQTYPRYHQRFRRIEIVPHTHHLYVSEQVPAECQGLWLRCLAFYEAKIDEAKESGCLAAELEYWQAFMAIGGRVDYGIQDIVRRIHELQAQLNLFPE